MANIQLYTKSYCPYCVRAKNLMQAKGMQFTEINLDGKEQERAELSARTGWRTVPQIFIGERFIGGYDDLAALDQSGELDRMLAAT